MVLALDASLSMMAQDERPSRLERMKEEVRRLRALSPGDRMGVLAFAGRSYVLSPLTIDEGALDLFLDNLDPSVVGQAGSSLARTIRQGVDLLTLTNSGADRALVVMSDGEAFEPLEDVIAEAKRAARAGNQPRDGRVRHDGRARRFRSRIPTDRRRTKKDENGNTVITQYHPEFLKGAADAAGGTFIDAGATDKAARVKSALATLRTQARASLGGETKTPRYQWFLFPALLLAAARHAAHRASRPSRAPPLGRADGRRRAIAADRVSLNGCAAPHAIAAGGRGVSSRPVRAVARRCSATRSPPATSRPRRSTTSARRSSPPIR